MSAASVHTSPSSRQIADDDSDQDRKFEFEITAANAKAVDNVKKILAERLKQLVETESTESDLIGMMGSEYVNRIMRLKSDGISIKIGELVHQQFLIHNCRIAI